jgi:hypothetical protein
MAVRLFPEVEKIGSRVMGHNCSGVKRTARMKRAKKHEARLAEKALAKQKAETVKK